MALKKLMIALVWALAAAAGIGLFVFYLTGPSTKEWAIGVAVFAVSLEIAFWTTAALLGLTLWESRKRVARFITAPFQQRREH